MKNIKALLQNKNDVWETPKEIYNFYKEQNYYDPCPINPTFNGLQIEWKEHNFVNPPYSQIKQWVKKAIEEKNKGKQIILLIPARTDTQWFKELLKNCAQIELIEGRLKFSNKNSAPFPSMLVYLSKYYDLTYNITLLTKEEKKTRYGTNI